MPKPPMVGFSRPTNLRDILVRSKVPGQPKSNNLRRRVGFKRCNMARCETCPFTQNSTTHTSNFTNKTFPINDELSCFTPNTIYSVTCTKDSGIFYKKSGKSINTCPPTGNSMDGQTTNSCPRTAPKILEHFTRMLERASTPAPQLEIHPRLYPALGCIQSSAISSPAAAALAVV